MNQNILSCAVGRWTSIWGDPVMSGTAVMLAYAVAASLTAWVAYTHAGPRTYRGLWAACAALLAFQVANTHLDLQVLVGSLGRCMAHAQGWYGHKDIVKLGAAAVAGVLLAVALLWVLVRCHKALRRHIWLTAGMGMSLGMSLAHAVGVGDGPMGWVIEMAGIVLIILAAVLHLRRSARMTLR